MKIKEMCILKIILTIIGFAVLTSYSGQWEVITGKNDVRDIALTGNTLWAATTGGVVKWNLDDNSYKSFTTLDGLISCNINQVAIDKKGRPWVATKDPASLFVFENNEWKQMNVGGDDNEIVDNIISGLEVDQFGNVWVCPRRKGSKYLTHSNRMYLWRYDGQRWYKHEGVYGPLALDLQNNLLAVDWNYDVDTSDFNIVSFSGSEFVGKWGIKIPRSVWWIVLADIAQDCKGNPWFSYYGDRYDETVGVVCNNILYNTLDGLADDNVRSITADESGTVWCATDGGISKFTEAGFITYDTTKGVASNLVYKILTDDKNTLYAATSKGISVLKSNRFETLKTIYDPSHNKYTDMAIDKWDAVILSGDDHIAIYNDLQWKLNYFRNIRFVKDSWYSHVSYNSRIKTFIQSEDGTLYAMGNEDRGDFFKKGWILKQETDKSSFCKSFSYTFKNYNRFLSPAVAGSSNDSCFWLTDHDDNLILINKQTTEIFPPSQFGIEGKNNWITCMLLDRDGRSVWVGYNSDGIVHFDGDAVKKRIYVNDGLASGRMTAIARDSSKNLWFASRWDISLSGGVAVLRNTKLTTYLWDGNGKELGSCNELFVEKSGIVWTHAVNGIARFDGSSWKLFDSAVVSPDLPYAVYSHIIQDKSETVWFGTSGSGLLAYKDNKWYQFTTRDGLPSNRIRCCALDSKNNLWILTDHGIAMRKSDETDLRQAPCDFLKPGNKRIIKQRDNRFYVSSKDKLQMIRYTLFDLRGRVVHRQKIHRKKNFIIPENKFNFRLGSGLRILSITIEDTGLSENKYLLKMGDIK